MKKYIAVLCCLLSVLSIQAQDGSRQKDVGTLFEWFKKASGFDRNYPREKGISTHGQYIVYGKRYTVV